MNNALEPKNKDHLKDAASISVDKTQSVYGLLWTKDDVPLPCEGYHFDKMQEVIGEKMVRGFRGIDVGSGCGYDTFIMAKNNPSVKIISMDISDGIYTNLKLNRGLSNVCIVKGSVLHMPFKEGVFDFAYSFGVLHHTPDPRKGLLEVTRTIKHGSPVFLYLYEDHSENTVKFIAIKIINIIRRFTTKMPPRLIYFLSLVASPFIFIFFSTPARIFNRCKYTKKFAEKIPFNFGTSLFSLTGDLYDRFGAPIEHRFSRKEIKDMFGGCNLPEANITKLKATAGWVAWGYKKGKNA
jgi:ubiquinone/menaquinone biosynthesis C-methylase UbiE